MKDTEMLAELDRDKQLILILQNASSVDTDRHRLLQQCVVLLEGIASGETAIVEGRMVTHAHARKRMARRLK